MNKEQLPKSGLKLFSSIPDGSHIDISLTRDDELYVITDKKDLYKCSPDGEMTFVLEPEQDNNHG